MGAQVFEKASALSAYKILRHMTPEEWNNETEIEIRINVTHSTFKTRKKILTVDKSSFLVLK